MLGEDVIVCIFFWFVLAAIVEVERFLRQHLNAFLVL